VRLRAELEATGGRIEAGIAAGETHDLEIVVDDAPRVVAAL
jgi:hypothetical protein